VFDLQHERPSASAFSVYISPCLRISGDFTKINISLWLEEQDWHELEKQAAAQIIPKHVYARALLTKAIRKASKKSGAGRSRPCSNAICKEEGGI
jgi:hypothetical protein